MNLVLTWKDFQEGLRNESIWLQSFIQSGRTFTKIFDSDLLPGLDYW